MRTLFESFGLGSPAPYERAFAPFSCGFCLEKLAQNSLERHRYGALALRQNSQKSPRNLESLGIVVKSREF
ncbi:hypothetical protein PTQ33_00825 [Campylobacter sp. 50012-21]|uniref:hypothetical protein n=1 Tax=Campylobacter magnus TaxID=3026462 RepID=UPI00235FC5DD|nr:hypothetical protein [Campylobacter magnus]MDD0845671.1 hypothetical protein [Campylobacter magnus]